MGDVGRSQLGLGHAYSRGKVKFNVNRSDNMIIQAIAMLDQLDKDVNTFAMRVREWYGWHFPELVKIVNDNYQYAKCVVLIQDKNCLRDKSKEEDLISSLSDILDDDSVRAKNVIDAGRASMGSDIAPIDLTNVINFAERVISIFAYRKSLQTYLNEKMSLVAPNLASLIGDVVGARLISHAGSLTNLSKYPASTVQILGAEKALFRALKTKGNTPKYGLIYNVSDALKQATIFRPRPNLTLRCFSRVPSLVELHRRTRAVSHVSLPISAQLLPESTASQVRRRPT